jgi:hypothetical protein
MSAVSEIIVREYFELHGFFVRQQRKYVAPPRREDDEVDFLVQNPRQEPRPELPFELGPADLSAVGRAVVVVKAWHTDTFGPGVLANAPEIFRFLEPSVFQSALRAFGTTEPVTKLLVVPALPQARGAREQSIALLRAKGLDGVILFHSMLADLIDHIEVNRNYQKSDLLQVLRILKNYGFFKGRQLELFDPSRTVRARRDDAGKGEETRGEAETRE